MSTEEVKVKRDWRKVTLLIFIVSATIFFAAICVSAFSDVGTYSSDPRMNEICKRAYEENKKTLAELDKMPLELKPEARAYMRTLLLDGGGYGLTPQEWQRYLDDLERDCGSTLGVENYS